MALQARKGRGGYEYMAPGGGGPDRKYYQLTPEGQARLELLRADWRNMRDAIASFGVE